MNYTWTNRKTTIQLNNPRYLEQFNQMVMELTINADYDNLLFFRNKEDLEDQITEIIDDYLYLRDYTEDETKEIVDYLYDLKGEIRDALNAVLHSKKFRLYTLFW